MSDVITFGEIMLRLTPPLRQRFAQAAAFEITFGGAEANVAVMLAQLGANVDFVTRLPQNEIAQRAINELRGLGVGVDKIVRGGERMGVYFLEHGASQRGGKVIYDRAHSALAEAQPSDFVWPHILTGAKWLHWSGITPALSPVAASIVAESCMISKRRGLTISFDLNYRAKLWSCEAAGDALAPLMPHVDLCVTSVEEARAVFGLTIEATNSGREEDAARRLVERFGFHSVALTMRQADTANSTSWSAMLFAEGHAWFSRRYEIAIVDRVGAGDSFSGALIFALRRGDDPQRAIDFAVAASTLKHTLPGDYNLVTLDEVEALVGGAGGGRVQR
ncbi:MAG: 2-dehydro-3-deoxygluconokinase [Chthoniobacter sp.]|jgi:2-dehydro-3-deoxygluconokinase|nr:2-dehydro-3-deoxygluconokinase [Chthoniobacter sp.]